MNIAAIVAAITAGAKLVDAAGKVIHIFQEQDIATLKQQMAVARASLTLASASFDAAIAGGDDAVAAGADAKAGRSRGGTT